MRCTTWSTGSSCIGCSNQAPQATRRRSTRDADSGDALKRCEQAQRQDENQHTVRHMNGEIGQLEGKRIKAAEIMVERKTQLGNRSAGRPRTTAANAARQRLNGERFEPHTLHCENVRQIVEEKLAVQTGPVDAKQREADKYCQNNNRRSSHRHLQKKKPLGRCQGALLKPNRLEVLAGTRQVLAVDWVGRTLDRMSKQPFQYVVLPSTSQNQRLVGRSTQARPDRWTAVVTVISPAVALVPV